MARPSFYQLYERVLAEGPFWDMIKGHWKTGWNIGKDAFGPPRPLPAWLTGLFSSPPRTVDTDPLSAGHDDPFGGGGDDPFGDLHDPFGDGGTGDPDYGLPPGNRLATKKAYKPPQTKFTKRYYPFGAFSNFYVEKPLPVRRRSAPGRVGASKVGADAVLRRLRQEYRRGQGNR